MNQPAQPVPVEQSDRHLASELYRRFNYGANEAVRLLIRCGLEDGERDDDPIVQLVARHRIASTPAPHGDDRLREALERGPDFGAPTREPGLRDIVFRYYRPHFDAAEATRLTDAYCAALASAPPVGAERQPHVFLDCDGVLADFDTYAEAYFGMNPRAYEKQMGSAKFWQQLEAKGDFYRNLPLMPDAMALYEGVKHLHPTILTGCPRGDWAQGQKVAWAAEHFPGVPIITCRSADKRDYAKSGDVLIDDWPQHRHRWIEMGGVFIVHHDAVSSLAALWAHYPSLAASQPDDTRQGDPA